MGESDMRNEKHQGILFEHGIFADSSDIRAHVAPGTRAIYVYRTKLLQAHLIANPDKYKIVFAGQPGEGEITSQGYKVTWNEIPDIRRLRWDSYPWWEAFGEKTSTSEKGRRASEVVKSLLHMGKFPLWCIDPARESQCLAVQIKGTDIVLTAQWKIQVKCDWWAGEGGTGNLYIETHERNPKRLH